MMESSAPSAVEVFERLATYERWDDDYYPPRAQWYYDRAVRDMLGWLAVRPGDTVLDAGTGPGVHAIRAARYGCRVRAIDVSAAALAEAQRRVTAAGVAERVTFEQADLTRLPYADASFARIFCWGVVIHIPDIAAALRELVRVLQPGGRLALYVTNVHALDYYVRTVGARVLGRVQPEFENGPLGRGCWFEMNGERLWVWRVRAGGLVRFLGDAGLRLVRRRAGSFTELHRRMRGLPRELLLAANNWYYALHLPAGPCVAQLLVFEKAS